MIWKVFDIYFFRIRFIFLFIFRNCIQLLNSLMPVSTCRKSDEVKVGTKSGCSGCPNGFGGFRYCKTNSFAFQIARAEVSCSSNEAYLFVILLAIVDSINLSNQSFVVWKVKKVLLRKDDFAFLIHKIVKGFLKGSMESSSIACAHYNCLVLCENSWACIFRELLYFGFSIVFRFFGKLATGKLLNIYYINGTYAGANE